MGPVAVPQLLVDQVGCMLARLILLGQEYVEISQLGVGGGSLTISGRYVQ
jgi:hypothetical protein